MNRQLRILEIKAAALQGQSDLLRLRLSGQLENLERGVSLISRSLSLLLLAWRNLVVKSKSG